jgi:hypothetical protein
VSCCSACARKVQGGAQLRSAKQPGDHMLLRHDHNAFFKTYAMLLQLAAQRALTGQQLIRGLPCCLQLQLHYARRVCCCASAACAAARLPAAHTYLSAVEKSLALPLVSYAGTVMTERP